MKKIGLLAIAILTGATAFAQQSVLKEAERAMKDKAGIDKVVSIITPAFTNPETEKLAQTYYIPGKAAYDQFDELFKLKAFNKLPENGVATMGKDLIEGYDFFMKALPLDSLPDAKGKVKPKYSKDILSTIGGHYSDYNNTAIDLWGIKDFKSAYKCWDIYLNITKDASRYKGIVVPHDTLLCEIMYNQALAAWQADELKNALNSFMNAKAHGYTKKNLYDYAISVAAQAEDTVAVLELAREALPMYGSEDALYIRYIINDYLIKKDFPNALQAINQAIANDPQNAQYYVVLGVIYDNDNKRADAKDAYKKAIELKPDDSMALFYYGKDVCEDAYELSDKGPSDPALLDAYFNDKIRPVLLEAAEYLEKAYAADNENLDALKYLENVYYNLKDEVNLEKTQQRLQN